MKNTIKRILKWGLLLWALGILITGVVIPRFQKDLPDYSASPSASQIQQERIRCIHDNQEALIRRLQVIESAKEELILSTYYLADDNSGRDIMSALQQAGERGVKVRVLVDGLCAFTEIQNKKTFQALAQSENIEVKIYNPVNLLYPWWANYRMHDKYLIADREVYICGGRNTKDVSLGNYPGKHDIDRDILVVSEGNDGSPEKLAEYFETVWALPESKTLKGKSRNNQPGREVLHAHYQSLTKSLPEAFETADFQALTYPVDRITVLNNPPEAESKSPKLLASLMEAMSRGKDIRMETPYIICNKTMYQVLTLLNSGGRDIKILTNSPDFGANPCGCADFLNQRRNLRKTGAEVWEYTGGQSSHTKTILVDDNVSIVGSFNFDMRSTYLDTETMLVIESEELNRELRQINEESMRFSHSIGENGQEQQGAAYVKPPFSLPREILYSVLRILILPLRHLL